MGFKFGLFYLLKGFFLFGLEESYSVVEFADVHFLKFTHFSGVGHRVNGHY
jgi:hypothetical protein